jgi:streptomycin 6-kinase
MIMAALSAAWWAADHAAEPEPEPEAPAVFV